MSTRFYQERLRPLAYESSAIRLLCGPPLGVSPTKLDSLTSNFSKLYHTYKYGVNNKQGTVIPLAESTEKELLLQEKHVLADSI